MKTLISERSANFLLNASLLFKETCPELSRFYLQGYEKANTKASVQKKSICPLQSTTVCSHCYQWLQPDNHRVRLRPKQRPPARVWSILRRHAKGKRLSLAQKHLLRRFKKSSSVLMATCNTCNQTSRHRGMNRDFIATIARTHSTPGSASKPRTPQSTSRSNMSTPKTTSKDKTPAHTPRSSTSSNTSGSGSSASKTPSKSKNWVVQRLSKILLREDTKSSKKGGLKDFLSSL
ncbi:UPF0711 protein C18orf21 homolog [Pleuronectes platessa]|uniref:UPF0711 protein C18orf21 homolog n=1 Tax=Pleuronectes platessa TaxID=8262 RepID=UPI00232A4D7B|nr:UPF0711 protein C18orf21 homolog [Pleuronectes platessa]